MQPPPLSPTPSVILAATLGGRPQVITFALDALLARGVAVDEVLALYLDDGDARLARSVARLAAEFHSGYYRERAGRPPRFRAEAILAPGHAPIDGDAAADAVWRAVHERIGRLKAGGATLHICLSGGRRILSLMILSAAMLHFGHHDALWHMYTPAEWQEEAGDGMVMHLPPDSGFGLYRVPLAPLGGYFPAIAEMARPLDQDEALARRPAGLVERARAGAVRAQLTPRQRQVLEQLAGGDTPGAAAARLGMKPATLDSHKTVILRLCRQEWGIPEDARLDYHFIREKFGRGSI